MTLYSLYVCLSPIIVFKIVVFVLHWSTLNTMFVYCKAFILAVDRWQYHSGNNVTCKFVTSLLLDEVI